jgi:hypothetical protein
MDDANGASQWLRLFRAGGRGGGELSDAIPHRSHVFCSVFVSNVARQQTLWGFGPNAFEGWQAALQASRHPTEQRNPTIERSRLAGLQALPELRRKQRQIGVSSKGCRPLEQVKQNPNVLDRRRRIAGAPHTLLDFLSQKDVEFRLRDHLTLPSPGWVE